MNGIHRVKGVCGDRPVIEGTHVEPKIILEHFMAGMSVRAIACHVIGTDHHLLSDEQVEAALRFECCKACRCKECRWARGWAHTIPVEDPKETP